MADQSSALRPRVESACDLCKTRKVRCDGGLPCGRCARRKRPGDCKYTIPNRRKLREQGLASPPTTVPILHEPQLATTRPRNENINRITTSSSQVDEDETTVPREARLLRDTRGKLVFIGDCAPLSFLQTVRQMLATCVDPGAFAHQGRDPVIEQTETKNTTSFEPGSLSHSMAETGVRSFFQVTDGLADLFDCEALIRDVFAWLAHRDEDESSISAVLHLVLAIGFQDDNESISALCFHQGRHIALSHLAADVEISSVQAFYLVSLYLLRACQSSGAFLYFGLAARASYSIGLHRAEVNTFYGEHSYRYRLYKSLKILDLFLSTTLGRPPAITDVDCTIPYRESTLTPDNELSGIDATLRILLIIEDIVQDVYSQRKISIQIVDKISARLKEWAERWLPYFQSVLRSTERGLGQHLLVSACQTVTTYYYGIMLVTRPFLMYDIGRILKERSQQQIAPSPRSTALSSRRMKFTESCIDAACLLVDQVQQIINKDIMPRKMPLIVPWIFTASLALGVGLIGNLGLVLEQYMRTSISILQYFAQSDPRASQYASIVEELLKTATDFLMKRDLEERERKAKVSSDLFGMVHRAFSGASGGEVPADIMQQSTPQSPLTSTPSQLHTSEVGSMNESASFHPIDPTATFTLNADFFLLDNDQAWTAEQNHNFGTANLFPSFETNTYSDSFLS